MGGELLTRSRVERDEGGTISCERTPGRTYFLGNSDQARAAGFTMEDGERMISDCLCFKKCRLQVDG